MTVHLVLPAAGVGRRFGADIPKQYTKIAGQSVMSWTLARCAQFPIDGLTVVAVAQADHHADAILAQYSAVQRIVGGAERVDSVLNALESIESRAHPDDWVLVHDIARPNVSVEDVTRLLNYCKNTGHGAILAKPMTDTIKQKLSDNLIQTIDRNSLWAALTPQCFPLFALLGALRHTQQRGIVVTDEASAMEACGFLVGLVEGSASNIKLTSSADAALLEYYLTQTE